MKMKMSNKAIKQFLMILLVLVLVYLVLKKTKLLKRLPFETYMHDDHESYMMDDEDEAILS